MNTPETIAIKLSRPGERAVKQGHPWVFDQSIEKGPRDAAAGSLCVLFDRRSDRPYAFGLWDPGEIIRIRIIYRGDHLKWDDAFLKAQLQEAFKLRKSLVENVTGYRAIHGENDGFPGLVLDVYDRTGVVKIYSAIWIPYLTALLPLIEEVFQLDQIVFRRSRKLMTSEAIPYKEGEVIGKPLPGEKIRFEEYGVSFYADPIAGHKTGFFLDQRANRFWVQKHASGRSVLDVFSYVGGFGIHALKGGASSLTSLDISAQAMEVARENIISNDLDRKSTRLNSSHVAISYAVFCLKKKKKNIHTYKAPNTKAETNAKAVAEERDCGAEPHTSRNGVASEHHSHYETIRHADTEGQRR